MLPAPRTRRRHSSTADETDVKFRQSRLPSVCAGWDRFGSYSNPDADRDRFRSSANRKHNIRAATSSRLHTVGSKGTVRLYQCGVQAHIGVRDQSSAPGTKFHARRHVNTGAETMQQSSIFRPPRCWFGRREQRRAGVPGRPGSRASR